MKKALNFLFNLFWVLTVGLASAISSGIMGIACCVTIIGIPLGLQHFKFIPLVFAPAGKRVARRFSSHPVLNTLWLIFGGLEAFILYGVLGVVCCMTIVGAPLGVQLFKIASFNLSPFGAEIVHEYQYTEKKKSTYDRDLLSSYILADPDRVMEDGTAVKDYFADLKEEMTKMETISQMVFPYAIVGLVVSVMTAVMDVVMIKSGGIFLAGGIIVALIIAAGMIVFEAVFHAKAKRKFKERLDTLYDLYPCGEKPATEVNLAMLVQNFVENGLDKDEIDKKIKSQGWFIENNWKSGILLGIIADIAIPLVVLLWYVIIVNIHK